MKQNTGNTGRPRSKKVHEAIIKAARKLVLKEGYACVSLQSIADEAGSSRQTIYRWWEGKPYLYLEVLKHEYRPIAQNIPPAEENSLEHYFSEVYTTGSLLFDVCAGLLSDSIQDKDFQKIYRAFIAERRAYIHSILEATAKRNHAKFAVPLDVVTDMVIGIMWYRIVQENLPLTKGVARNLEQSIQELLISE